MSGKNLTKLWFPAHDGSCAKAEQKFSYKDKSPSSLCKTKEQELCYCKGSHKAQNGFQLFCGSCQLTLKPDKKRASSKKIETTANNMNSVLKELLRKMKRRQMVMQKEWTQMDEKKECVNTKEAVKFYKQNPSTLCASADKEQCLCVRNPGEQYEKVCGKCLLAVKTTRQVLSSGKMEA